MNFKNKKEEVISNVSEWISSTLHQKVTQVQLASYVSSMNIRFDPSINYEKLKSDERESKLPDIVMIPHESRIGNFNVYLNAEDKTPVNQPYPKESDDNVIIGEIVGVRIKHGEIQFQLLIFKEEVEEFGVHMQDVNNMVIEQMPINVLDCPQK